MKSQENGVFQKSNLFFHIPSTEATMLFFYPICVGHYYYETTYQLKRNSYDSFLLMYMLEGSCEIVTKEISYTATKGQVVLLDCYEPHEYSTTTGWECYWIHFDGTLARGYYDAIMQKNKPVITPFFAQSIETTMKKIYESFSHEQRISEAIVSCDLTSILTELLCTSRKDNLNKNSLISEQTISYINKHLDENLSLNFLASLVHLSPFYFARIFKKETGMAPHEYIITARLESAKFHLKTSNTTIEEIAITHGFPTSSSFCACFKKHMQMTPMEYRNFT